MMGETFVGVCVGIFALTIGVPLWAAILAGLLTVCLALS